MGHSSKKKKKRGSGGRKSSLKDDGSFSAENSELINDELTALCAIFQEDCKVVSESPPQVSVKLRPYSKDTGYENSDISAFLSIRFLSGYPNKCPKLQIIPEKGLSEIDADKLLSLLLDQANYNSREGRVMIYNLVEAAQEFLSEIVPLIPYEVNGQSSQLPLQDEAVSCAFINSSRGPFVNVHVDLFSALGESWHWNLGMDQSTDSSSSLYSNAKVESELIHRRMFNKTEQKTRSIPTVDGKQDFQRKSALNLIIVEEGSEDERRSNADSSSTLSAESVGSFPISGAKDMFAVGNVTESSDYGSAPSESDSSEFIGHNGSSQTMKTDLIMAHLLRLACASKGPLADALPQITSELYDLGIVGEHVRELALKPSSLFDRTFGLIFGQEMVSSTSSPFWKTYADFGGQHSSSVSSSRFLSDFEEIQPLGQGGFGLVVLCKNKLDGRQYAMKKIRLKDKSLPLNDRILREVATLSRLQHQHVVRYYQAWFETGISVSHGDAALGSRTAASSTFSFKDGSSYGNFGPDNKFDSTYLYIQMEYCPRTLRQMFESYNHFDKELAWHLFRQIVEGLAHIHAQGIIHRDLTPSNIFFDARNDIKIGDFGLAKFLKLEQMEQDVDAADAVGVSLDGTGQVGTYFYTAPEIEQGWPKINEKADMYSLGVVFLELWHPFDTSMERHVVLSELKQKGGLPSTWANEFPEQAALLKRLMSPSPSDRPSATELLQHAFPPRMEFELLDNILRTIHTSEDTSLYDKIVNAVFDEESLRTKDHPEGVGGLKLVGSDTSSFLLPDTNTANRDHVVEVASKVFRQHCAKRLEIIPLHLSGDDQQYTRSCVKLLTQGGDMVELCHELRLPFVKWVIENQKLFYKRYEISNVYRRGIGHSPPSRYLQGDFDIIGGATALTEAETIKATIEIIGHFFHLGSCDIHLNHGHLLEALWNWAGIRPEHWQKVAELLSLLTSLHPQSPERKSKWVVVRRQLRQELNLPEVAVNRLQTVGLRFCGAIDQTLPRLRGALPEDNSTRRALDELSELYNYLRVWRISSCVFVDALMPPTEYYHKNIFFQVYLRKIPGTLSEGTLLAIGGRYDFLLQSMGDSHKANLPGGVGTSLALETILSQQIPLDGKHYRFDAPVDILVCSRGGGGLLNERMELVNELWEENIKAEFVPVCDPSLTEQYEYANENNIKCLVIITGASQTDSVKVRHIELKKEKEIERESLVKFLSAAMATQFRNPALWN